MKNLFILIFLLFISSCASINKQQTGNNIWAKPEKPKVIEKNNKYIKSIEKNTNESSQVLNRTSFIK